MLLVNVVSLFNVDTGLLKLTVTVIRLLSWAQAFLATIVPPPLRVTLMVQAGAGDAGGDRLGVGVGVGVGVGDGTGIIFRVTVDSTVPPVPVATNFTGNVPTAVAIPLLAEPVNGCSPVGVVLLST